jgi:hypothetical protein
VEGANNDISAARDASQFRNSKTNLASPLHTRASVEIPPRFGALMCVKRKMIGREAPNDAFGPAARNVSALA